MSNEPRCRCASIILIATLSIIVTTLKAKSAVNLRSSYRDSLGLSEGTAWFDRILRPEDRSFRSGPVRSLPIRRLVAGGSQTGEAGRARVNPLWGSERGAWNERMEWCETAWSGGRCAKKAPNQSQFARGVSCCHLGAYFKIMAASSGKNKPNLRPATGVVERGAGSGGRGARRGV